MDLHGHFDGCKISELTDRGDFCCFHTVNSIPEVDISLVTALRGAVHGGLEAVREKAPGQRVIADIDIVKVILDELFRSGAR